MNFYDNERYMVRGKAAIFNLDGTLVNSTSALRVAWTKLANEVGENPKKVIGSTDYGRRIENLARLKPDLKPDELQDELARFEESIFHYSDAYKLRRRRASPAKTSSTGSTPSLTPDNSPSTSRRSSVSSTSSSTSTHSRRSFFANKLHKSLFKHSHHKSQGQAQSCPQEDESWKAEAASINCSIRILPGVKDVLKWLQRGNDIRYAIKSAGSTDYASKCMDCAGLTRPEVVVTGDDRRSKPTDIAAIEPLVLAAEWMGYYTRECIVFEDSPAGIRAAVASGATVIAVCTGGFRPEELAASHPHYVVDDLSQVSGCLDDMSDCVEFVVYGTEVHGERRWMVEDYEESDSDFDDNEDEDDEEDEEFDERESSDSDFDEIESSDSDFAEYSDEEEVDPIWMS